MAHPFTVHEPSDFDLALRLGPAPKLSPEDVLAERLRLVLETQPGSLPYAPTFGCDLAGIVGRTADTTRLNEARMRISSAVQRWIPDAAVTRLTVELSDNTRAVPRAAGVPVAEAVLASEATSATLNVHLVVETPAGPVEIDAALAP